MSREINSLVHDTLLGMLNKKNSKNKKDDLYVDWKTFNSFSSI